MKTNWASSSDEYAVSRVQVSGNANKKKKKKKYQAMILFLQFQTWLRFFFFFPTKIIAKQYLQRENIAHLWQCLT